MCFPAGTLRIKGVSSTYLPSIYTCAQPLLTSISSEPVPTGAGSSVLSVLAGIVVVPDGVAAVFWFWLLLPALLPVLLPVFDGFGVLSGVLSAVFVLAAFVLAVFVLAALATALGVGVGEACGALWAALGATLLPKVGWVAASVLAAPTGALDALLFVFSIVLLSVLLSVGMFVVVGFVVFDAA